LTNSKTDKTNCDRIKMRTFTFFTEFQKHYQFSTHDFYSVFLLEMSLMYSMSHNGINFF